MRVFVPALDAWIDAEEVLGHPGVIRPIRTAPHNHGFVGTQQAEYNALKWRGRDLYDALRWFRGADHATAFAVASEKHGKKDA